MMMHGMRSGVLWWRLFNYLYHLFVFICIIYLYLFGIQPALGILMALVILERTIKSVLGVNND